MKSIIKFFFVTFIFTWIFQLVVVLESRQFISLPFSPLIFLLIGTFAPSLCAFFLTWRKRGFSGLRQFVKKGFDVRMPLYIYLFVAFVPLGISLSAYLITGGNKFNVDILSLLATFVLYFFLGGSFGEEFGWRGYALPKMLRFYNPLTATLMLGVVWSSWHLPLFWINGTSQSLTPVWLFFIATTAAAFKYTWVFLRTEGSIFACLLLHTFVNITVVVFPIEAVNGIDSRIYYETLFEVILAVVLFLTEYKRFTNFPPQTDERVFESENPVQRK